MTDQIKEFLKLFVNVVPLEWDRYTENEGFYNVYGWIKRTDKQRDFLLLQFDDSALLDVGFVTSSAKYSKAIHDYLSEDIDEHNDCIKIEL